MTTLDYPSKTLTRLTDSQRVGLIDQLNADGFFVLPGLLAADCIKRLTNALDQSVAAARAKSTGLSSVKIPNIVDLDPAFLELAMHEPAMQLAYDCFGPSFHLCQSNLVSRPRDKQINDFVGSSPWHADGPRPAMFPAINGVMGLHYLKFGYFLTDLTHGNGGSLQVVRGSHLRPELDRTKHYEFNIDKYKNDLVQIDCPAGTVVGFHQAQWHAAPPNESNFERKNCYVSYCPTWMKPLDRDLPMEKELEGRNSEERWILGEPRPPIRWWLPKPDELTRMSRFARDAHQGDTVKTVRYD